VIDRSRFPAARNLANGAYILWQTGDAEPEIILIGTGSEVSVVLAAAETLAADGLSVRVVSMPSWELFERCPRAERDRILPPSRTVRLAVEAGCGQGWERYVGTSGRFIGMNRYGASAPAKVLAEKFGFTAAHVVEVARAMLSGTSH
jgi:transketolase